MRYSIFVWMLLAGAVHAQVYKCQEGGRTVYSQAPCREAGQVLDPRRPTDPAVQGAQPLTQRREVERALPAEAASPEPAPAVVPAQNVAGACPDDNEFRNLQTAASSITTKGDEKLRRQLHLTAAQRCRTNGTTMNAELVKLEQEAAADDALRQMIRDELRKCTVGVNGFSGTGALHCRR